MFENLISQSAAVSIKSDLERGLLARSMIFFGAKNSGKFTAALELARVLSCKNGGEWTCGCESCRQHRLLVSSDLLVVGFRECLPEIRAAVEIFSRFCESVPKNAPMSAEQSAEFDSLCILFARAVRKLLVRFSPTALEGNDKISKIAPLVEELNETLENFDAKSPKILDEKFAKNLNGVVETAQKLENEFLPESISIAKIRNVSAWTQFTSERKKTVILENADMMNDSAGNALLKTLEEPNENCNFILLTENKRRIMPTLLSRARSYGFAERPPEIQRNVVSRVFHLEKHSFRTLDEFFAAHQNLPNDEIKNQANFFVNFAFRNGERPDVEKLFAALQKFEPKSIFKKYLTDILNCASKVDFQNLPPEKKSLFYGFGGMMTDALRQTSIFNRNVKNVLETLIDRISAN